MFAGFKTITGEKSGSQVRRSALVLLVAFSVAVLVGLIFFNRTTISAQARAVVVLPSLMDTPVLAPAVAGLTGEPVLEDEIVVGVPTVVARPAGEGPWPALVFGNGAVPPGRREPDVRRLAQGLARAGYVVYVPDVSGLRDGEITGRTVAETVDVARAAAESPDTRDGLIGFVGVSVGASLVLLAAQDPELADRISGVSVVAPYADLKEVLRLATTGTYRGDGKSFRYATPDYLRLVAARSLVSLLPPGEDRESLLKLIPEIDHYYPSSEDSEDPLIALPAFGIVNSGNLRPETERVLDLLTNQDPERFDALYAALPSRMRAEIERLSPAAEAKRLRAPVEIASAPRDVYFPLAEQRELARNAPENLVRVTVTAALSHANLEPSFNDTRALLRLNGFVVRSLRETRQ